MKTVKQGWANFQHWSRRDEVLPFHHDDSAKQEAEQVAPRSRGRHSLYDAEYARPKRRDVDTAETPLIPRDYDIRTTGDETNDFTYVNYTVEQLARIFDDARAHRDLQFERHFDVLQEQLATISEIPLDSTDFENTFESQFTEEDMPAVFTVSVDNVQVATDDNAIVDVHLGHITSILDMTTCVTETLKRHNKRPLWLSCEVVRIRSDTNTPVQIDLPDEPLLLRREPCFLDTAQKGDKLLPVAPTPSIDILQLAYMYCMTRAHCAHVTLPIDLALGAYEGRYNESESYSKLLMRTHALDCYILSLPENHDFLTIYDKRVQRFCRVDTPEKATDFRNDLNQAVTSGLKGPDCWRFQLKAYSDERPLSQYSAFSLDLVFVVLGL